MSDAATSAPQAKARSAGRFAAVGIGVSDIDRSVAFYTGVLGMKQQQVFNLPHMKEVIVGYKDDISLALMHFIDGSNPNYANNPVTLVFYVDDPKGVADRIRAEGLEITREPEPLPEFGNMIVGLAKDPDGYVIELLKRPGRAVRTQDK
jgi:lactoylglutathione lyase